MVRTRKKGSKGKAIIIITVFLIIVGSIFFGSYGYFTAKKFDNLMYQGVKIDGIDMSQKTKEQAVQILNEKYKNKIKDTKINIKAPNKTYTIEYGKLNPKYNIEDTVKEAFSYGKQLNVFAKYKLIKNPIDKPYKLKYTYDGKAVEETIATMEADINQEASNATLSMVNGKFKIQPEKNGVKLQKEALTKEITSKIEGDMNGEILVQAPIETIKAEIQGEKLSTITTHISSFNTDFSSSNENRSKNIELSTRSINGKVIMPGDTFSFNDIVGERTVARGYKEAGVIVNNKIESGLGGGICQVSSTLYNAILRANIKGTEKVHHTLASSYVPLGLDATVDYGNIDYKFKNTLAYPIYIEGSTYNKNLTFNVYSNAALTKTEYKITTDVYETIQAKTNEIADPTKFEGEVEIVNNAYTGFRVKVFKSAYENGKLLDQELVTNEYYKPVDGEIKKGTKKK